MLCNRPSRGTSCKPRVRVAWSRHISCHALSGYEVGPALTGDTSSKCAVPRYVRLATWPRCGVQQLSPAVGEVESRSSRGQRTSRHPRQRSATLRVSSVIVRLTVLSVGRALPPETPEATLRRCWRRSEPSCNPVQSARLIDHRGARVFLALARPLSWASALCYTSDGAIGTFRVSTSLSVITLRSAIRFLLCLLADASGLLPSLSFA